MILTPEEIATLKGKDLLDLCRSTLIGFDADIRFVQGRQATPCPHELAKADIVHALDFALQFAIDGGPNTTIGKFTTHLRKALEDATRTRGIKHGPGPAPEAAPDISGAGHADPGAL